MILPDINVLIYAHREDAVEHEQYADWLRRTVNSPEPVALPGLVLSGFLRIVTNPRILDPPTPMGIAISFCTGLLEQPRVVPILPSEDHWRIFLDLCRQSGISGPIVSDAYLAALAIDHGCELNTTDGDFGRFEGLRWRHPLRPRPHRPA